MKKASIRRRLAAILACALAAAIVVSGAYAVTLLSQFDTNEFAGLGLRYDATLNEEFMEEGNWKEGQTVPKLISVTNTGLNNGNFGEVYVRLQLKEFMEFYEVEYKYWAIGADGKGMQVGADGNPALFMTTVVSGSDADGTSLETGDSTYVIIEGNANLKPNAIKNAAIAQYGELRDIEPNIFEERTFVYLTDAISKQSGWFVQTREHDINGQYGKWVVADFASDKENGESLDPNVERAENQDHGNYVQGQPSECLYTPCIMEADMEGYGRSVKFREWVQWNFGSLVMPLSEWKGEECWVYDDAITPDKVGDGLPYSEEDIGWFYWSHPLTPDADHATLKKTTDILLESIELAKQPEKDFYYAIHVDMDAQSTPWITAPVFTVSPYSNVTVVPGGSVNFTSALNGDDKTSATDWDMSNIAPMSASGYTIMPLSVITSTLDGWSLEEDDDKVTLTANADAENGDFIYIIAELPGYPAVSVKVTVTATPGPGEIKTENLTNPKVGNSYSKKLTATGPEPIAWAPVDPADLPPGLTLKADGTITGTPTTPGSYTFTVEAKNDGGTVTKVITLVVDPADGPGTKIDIKKPIGSDEPNGPDNPFIPMENIAPGDDTFENRQKTDRDSDYMVVDVYYNHTPPLIDFPGTDDISHYGYLKLEDIIDSDSYADIRIDEDEIDLTNLNDGKLNSSNLKIMQDPRASRNGEWVIEYSLIADTWDAGAAGASFWDGNFYVDVEIPLVRDVDDGAGGTITQKVTIYARLTYGTSTRQATTFNEY